MATTTPKACPAIALAAAVATLAITVPSGQPVPKTTEGAHAAHSAEQLIVRARPGVTTGRLRESMAARGLSLGRHIPHTELFAVRTNGQVPAAAIASLADAAAVAEAKPDYQRRAADVPNDPYFAAAPYLTTIRIPEAWGLSKGSAGVVIAVVDSGVSA